MAARREKPTKQYMPLVTASLSMLLLLALLPSALNLPQTNPAETLEYAPVPPEDTDTPPPPAGNLGSLGLGSSASIGTAGTGDLELPPPVGEAGRVVKTAATKRCVGSPPRQTEDPLSPPCVASFTGDNGGKTYKGVEADEIRVIYYIFGGTCRTTSRGRECVPNNESMVDLGKPPQEDEDVFARGIRDLQTYFNDRFQTYGRRVRFFVYYSFNGSTPERQRAAAIENIKKVDPFAVVYGISGLSYAEVMARRGVLNFSSRPGTPADYFTRFPKLIWSYLPSLEVQARSYSSMVCRQIVPFPASFSGNPGENGRPRRLGLLAPDPAAFGENFVAFARLVRRQIEDCGGNFVAEGRHPNGGQVNQTEGDKRQQIEQNMAAFRQNGVTTIIWPWGVDLGSESSASARQGYFPEWVLAGDTLMDGFDIGQTQDQQAFHRRAWLQTVFARSPAFTEDLCFTAMREANPQKTETDAGAVCRLYLAYEAIRQLFIGIQVAGPNLNPSTVDKGFHAIPPGPSGSPLVPACFYDPGDYTCIKDATAMYWDRDGSAPGSNAPGCWRMPDQGQRYLADAWPNRELSAAARPQQDPCNGYSSLSVNVNAGV
jgi:hypothetical protein